MKCAPLLFAIALLAVPPLSADELTLLIGNKKVELTGEILIEAQDQSLYFRENDGTLWFVKPDQLQRKIDDDTPVPPISKKELAKKLLQELPPGFRIYTTKHYVIAYQNEIAFARWIGGLYESRLYRAFNTYWKKKKKFPLQEPAYPLTAIIFGSKVAYQQYLTHEMGEGVSMDAYYNLQTNRIAMYDLTADRRDPTQPLNDRRIGEILQTRSAIPMVATIIHEGTHQLIFNRGIQTRFAEAPLWLNEGLAIYFETPNLNTQRGWRVPGLVNQQRLADFRAYLPTRPADSLKTMIESDDRLRDANTALAGYAEAWAFNHFLLNRHSDQYIAYLKFMATKKALAEDTAETRLNDFQRFLGDDLKRLDTEFLEYVRKLK